MFNLLTGEGRAEVEMYPFAGNQIPAGIRDGSASENQYSI